MPAHPLPNSEAKIIAENLKTLSEAQLLDRYHELVDLRLDQRISYLQAFELDRIGARLNAEDQGEIGRLRATQEDWARERSELVSSIEVLLNRFKLLQ